MSTKDKIGLELINAQRVGSAKVTGLATPISNNVQETITVRKTC